MMYMLWLYVADKNYSLKGSYLHPLTCGVDGYYWSLLLSTEGTVCMAVHVDLLDVALTPFLASDCGSQ
jgi:hypothetical protein